LTNGILRRFPDLDNFIHCVLQVFIFNWSVTTQDCAIRVCIICNRIGGKGGYEGAMEKLEIHVDDFYFD